MNNNLLNYKWLCMLAFMLSLSQALQAQTVAQIGTGTSTPTNTLYSPVYRFDAASTTTTCQSVILFTAAEISAAGINIGDMITDIAFHKRTVNNFLIPAQYTVMMGNTTTTPPLTGTTAAYWPTVLSTFSTVYTNTSFNLPNTIGWVTLTLNTPFVYTGGSLEIATDLAMTGGATGATGNFSWEYTTGFATYIIGTSSNTNLAQYMQRPNIRLTHMPSAPCTAPPVPGTAAVTPANICLGQSISLSRSGGSFGMGQTYQWESASALAGPWTPEGTAATSPALTLTPTTAGTKYYRCGVKCGASTSYTDTVSVNIPTPFAAGTYTINNSAPTGGTNFQSFTDAFAAINCGISGNIVFNVTAGQTFTENPAELNASGSATSTITFQKSGAGANPVITPLNAGTLASGTTLGSDGDGVIVINGGDFITFDGIDINTSSFTTGNDRFEYGYYLKKKSTTDACKDVTIKNATITLAPATIYSYGIFVSNNSGTTSGITVTSTGGRSENIKLSGNTIANAYGGIMVRGFAAAAPYDFYDQNIEVGVSNGNTISGFGGGATVAYGIYTIYQNNLKIGGNTVASVASGHTTNIYGIYTTTATNGNGEIYNNHVTVNAAGTTTISYGLATDMGSTGTNNLVSVHDNTVSNCTYTATSGSFYGLFAGGTAYNTHIYKNKIQGNTHSPTTTGVFAGIYQSGGVVNELKIYDNNVSGNNRSSGTTGASYGIYNTPAATTTSLVYNDTVYNNQMTATTGTLYGILQAAGVTANVFNNQVFDLVNTATTSGGTQGIAVTGGTTVNVYNNFVSDLRAPSTNSADAIRGIALISTVAGSDSFSHNTVFLNASSTGTNFGTSALYVTTATAANTANLTLRNNNLVDVSMPNGTGYAAAYRRSSTSLTNYGSSSNSNNFYSGTASANNVLFYDGTNADATLTAYKTRVAPIDNNAVSENPTFVNSSSAPYNLHIPASTTTQLESGGVPVPSVLTDIDGNARNPLTPDIGADEFVGSTPAPVISNIAKTPANVQCAATARTVTVNVTSVTPVTAVTINYNNGAVGSTSMTLQSGTTTNGTWSGTIPAAAPAGSNVTWSVTASNASYSYSAGGSAYRDAYLIAAATTATASPANICAGNASTLSVTTINGAAGFATVGTQTSTIGGNVGNPYRSGTTANAQVRTQMLVTAAELTAQGLSAGPITSLGFTTTGAGGTVINFGIDMSHTALTSLNTAFDNSPSTNVFTQASFTAVVGLNTHIFQTPFVWDGVSNLLVNVCQTQSVTGTNTVACYTPAYGGNVHTVAVGTACAAATGTAVAAKPIMTFGGVVGMNYTPSVTYTWTPGALTGSSVSVSPSANATYSVSGVDGNGCTVGPATVSVNVSPLPSAPAATGSTQCGTGIPTASVASTAGASGNGTFKWYDASTAGNLLQGQAVGNTLVNYYGNDFSTSTLTNASVSGTAAIASGVLTMHPATANQAGGFTVNASGVNSTMFNTGFDLIATSAGTQIADGLSYSFGDDALATTTTPTAEKGSGSKLRIGFLTYNNASTNNGKGIYVGYNVTATDYTATAAGILAYSNDTSWVPASATSITTPVNVNINAAGQLTLTIGTTTIFSNVQLPPAFLNADKSTWKHVFSSRSGGVAGSFGMDNLLIQANANVPGYTTYQKPVSQTTTFYVSEVGVNGCESARTPVVATVTLGPGLPSVAATVTTTQGDGSTNIYANASCQPLAMITDASGGNVLGSVTTAVTIDPSVQITPSGDKYLQRHYDITPASNGAATVVLYATQAEFNNYNAAPGSFPLMPASPTDPNTANVRVTKYSGTAFALPATQITPTSVVWNSTNSWWEITLAVPSFSSFYIHTGGFPLPVKLASIQAINSGSRNRVDWVTAEEKHTAYFELERSKDAKVFESIANLEAVGRAYSYSYWDEQPFDGVNYYRLKMYDKNGTYAYSDVVKATVSKRGRFAVEAYPNPVSHYLTVEVSGVQGADAAVQVTDVTGKVIRTVLMDGSTAQVNMSGLANGIYLVKYTDADHTQTIKVNKQ